MCFAESASQSFVLQELNEPSPAETYPLRGFYTYINILHSSPSEWMRRVTISLRCFNIEQSIISFLNSIAGYRGYPRQIRSDNGPEFLAHRLQQWAQDHRVYWQFIQPGKPAQNAFIERLNRTFREDVLDAFLFSDVREVQEIAFDWMEMYNNTRPHESLNNLSPQQYAQLVNS